METPGQEVRLAAQNVYVVPSTFFVYMSYSKIKLKSFKINRTFI